MDSGSTVTMSNGVVSILCTKAGATIDHIYYTYNNTGSTVTTDLLANSPSKTGQFYWETGGFGTGTFSQTEAFTTGDYGEITLLSTSTTNGSMEVHFSMRRGSPGFYVTAIFSHRNQDVAMSMGEMRDNIYCGGIFNWMSVDGERNKLFQTSGGSIAVQNAPKEVTLWTNGIYAGQYEDKYKYGADLWLTQVWGWSSVGTGGKNVGIWNVTASPEYYNGGPLKRELTEHLGSTCLNMLNGTHWDLGADADFAGGEVWTKVYGPYFIYCNNVTNTLTGTNAPAQALYADAQAQQAAEQSAWPYSWFTNVNYASVSGRGAITGKIVINDTNNPGALAGGLWVGVEQQPAISINNDFQTWMKPYEFWTKTDANGNFTISNVVAGTNYTLYAFGPGAPGLFMSQNQSGGNPPLVYNLPASPFSVKVSGNTTTNLGNVTWTPSRTGATVFEIGQPDRNSREFRHGDDFWVGDIGPTASAPSPVWTKLLEYPFDFPNDVNYVVGQSRWTTDWNFIQPTILNPDGSFSNKSSSTITFNLPNAPSSGSKSSLYLGFAAADSAAVIVTISGKNLSNISGVTSTPNVSISSTGYGQPTTGGYGSSNASIREGNHAIFFDNIFTFPATNLVQGQNTIIITLRGTGGVTYENNLMYDYVRLELAGYVPPPPTSITVYPGNNCNLISWPVTPGATSYNILRSTNSGSSYVSITNGVIGPVCGSGTNNATYLDTSAINGTNYVYVVRSVNPVGSSTNSAPSASATPSASIGTSAPNPPTNLTVSSRAHHSVTLAWQASSGANYYSIYRTTLVNSGGGSSNALATIILNNAVTTTNYTDISPTDGSIYRYYVTATSAGGTSTNSNFAIGIAKPTTPTTPASLVGSFTGTTNITISWLPVPGAVGYVISRATNSFGPYVYLQTVIQTNYTDVGLNPAVVYYYRVSAMNSGGVSGNNTDLVNSKISYPTSLTAVATNAQIKLNWSSVSNATSYTLKRGTSVGGESTTVVTGYTGTTYTNIGLANGTTYYYVVSATGTNGTSGNSPEASATPVTFGTGIWVSTVDGNWSETANWLDGSVASGNGNSGDFSTLSLTANVTVTLDGNRTISTLIFGDTTDTYDWLLSGTSILTLGTSPSIEVVNQSATLSTPIAGTAGLVKTGAGQLNLGGASESVTGGIVLNAGTLKLDYSASGSPGTNLVGSGNALSLGGGTLQINGNGGSANSQTFSGTTNIGGPNVITINNPSAVTLALGALGQTAAGTTLSILTNGAGNAAITASAGSNVSAPANAPIASATTSFNYAGAFVTFGDGDFAMFSGGAIVPLGDANYTTNAGPNADVSGSYNPTAGTALNCMRFNSNGSSTVTLAGSLGSGGILVTPRVGTNNATITGSSAARQLQPSRTSSATRTEAVIWQNNTNGYLVINGTVVLDNNKQGTANVGTWVQAGHGTLQYDQSAGQTNTFFGSMYLNGGFTLVSANGNTVFGNQATNSPLILNGGTVVAETSFALDDGGANLRPVTLQNNGGGLAAVNGMTLTVDGVVSGMAGTGPLIIGIAVGNALLPGSGPGTANPTPVYGTGTVLLNSGANTYTGGTILASGTLSFTSGSLGGGDIRFNGGSLQWVSNSLDISSQRVTVGSGGGTIDLNGNAVTFANSIGNGGSGALAITNSTGTGSLNLQAPNTYTGGTTISGGTVMVNNASGSATGLGDVTVQNTGVLSGGGGIAGSVTVLSGGTLAIGNTNDTLTINNNLILNAGSSTRLQIQHSPLGNSGLNIGNNLAFGGYLVVTNVGGTVELGDSFQLFNAPNFSGSFDNMVLPALTNGLAWDTNTFLATGTLNVVAVTSPVISSINISGGQMVIAGTNGIANANYYLLSTTNLVSPLADWNCIATNQFDVSGNFSVTNGIDMGTAQTFFIIKLQ